MIGVGQALRIAPYAAFAAAVVGLALWGWSASSRADRLADDLATTRAALKVAEDNAERAEISRDVWRGHAARMKAQAARTAAILEDIRNDPDADKQAGDAVLRALDRLGLRPGAGDREDGPGAD